MSRKMYRHTRRPAARVVKRESKMLHVMEQSHMRLASIFVGFGFSFLVLSLRLIEVSLVGGGELPFKRLVTEPQLMLQFEEKRAEEKPLIPSQMLRGDIVDRNGMLLATNVRSASLAANPTLIRQPEKVASDLARVLTGVSEADLRKKLSNRSSKFAYLKRHLTPGEQEKVNALGVPGLFFEDSVRRVYPFGAMGSHVVGYVDVDNQGISGIEKQFDAPLARSLDGEPVQLSLDIRLQAIMSEEIQKGMDEFKAIGGAGLIMDIHSGEMLSMVSLPSFDPHDAGKASADSKFNRVSLGVYEMGSTFKSFTAAMALDKGVVGMRDGYDASSPIRAAGYTINDSHPYYRWLSVPEIFAYSSNIGTVRMAMDIGTSYQKRFLRNLGMMEQVKIELPEKAQPLSPSNWRTLNTMTISYGHGISVSPLHLAQGIAAMVNGGTKTGLTLLKDGNKGKGKGERVIKEETSHNMRKLMQYVVQYGTAKKANVAGYRVGGKTGTAEKVVGGSYKDKAKLALFVGAFPIQDPRYLIFVMIDEPQGNKSTYGYATGGWVSAPVVSNVVSRMGPLMGIEPVFEAPDVKEQQYWAAAEQRNRDARERKIRPREYHAVSY